MAQSSDYTQQQNWVNGELITADKLNIDVQGLTTTINALDNDNISDSAAIVYSKLKFTGLTLGGSVLDGSYNFKSLLIFEGDTADGFETTFSITDPTLDRTITIPDHDVSLAALMHLDTDETVTGIKLYSTFPVTASEHPTTTYQVTNKSYVDQFITVVGNDIDDSAVSIVAETEIAAVTINTVVDQKTILMGTCRIAAISTSTSGTIFLYRDAVLLHSFSFVLVSGGTDAPVIPIMYIDTGAGTAVTTYKVKASANGNAPTAAGYISACQVR